MKLPVRSVLGKYKPGKDFGNFPDAERWLAQSAIGNAHAVAGESCFAGKKQGEYGTPLKVRR
jgi:hypothetical protein